MIKRGALVTAPGASRLGRGRSRRIAPTTRVALPIGRGLHSFELEIAQSHRREKLEGVPGRRDTGPELVVEGQLRPLPLPSTFDVLAEVDRASSLREILRVGEREVVCAHGTDCTGRDEVPDDAARRDLPFRRVRAVKHLVEQVENGTAAGVRRVRYLDDSLDAEQLGHEERNALRQGVLDPHAGVHPNRRK